jgi:HTH-type transcriptional regulator / antitoxin HigA
MPSMIKAVGKKIAPKKNIDTKRYGRLLAKALPGVIETEEEYQRLIAESERLIDKGNKAGLTAEERKLLNLIVLLIEQFEEEHYKFKKGAKPHDIIQELMAARDLKQKDLVPLFNSKGYASDVINGKRTITVEIAKKLGDFFNVDPGLFVF